MKLIYIIFFICLNNMFYSCSKSKKSDLKYSTVEYYTVDRSKLVTYDNLGSFSLAKAYLKDNSYFYENIDTISSFVTLDSLLSEIGIKRGDFYTLKNLAMPIQEICSENQLILFKNNDSYCTICFDDNKNYISYQDSVFNIRKIKVKEDSDVILSLPSNQLPKSKFLYKKTIKVL